MIHVYNAKPNMPVHCPTYEKECDRNAILDDLDNGFPLPCKKSTPKERAISMISMSLYECISPLYKKTTKKQPVPK
jgi:hypothetical protein